MAKLILPGGTDVAEVALFSVDALREKRSDDEELKRLEDSAGIIRFATGADGGYLLHAYVDEDVPADIMRFCSEDDKKTSRLSLTGGRIGFGGVESAFALFKPNVNIRSDGTLPPGDYDVEAFHTDFPDDVIESAVIERIGATGLKLLSLPGYVIPVVVLLLIVAAVLHVWTAAALIAGAAVIAWVLYSRNPTIKSLNDKKIAAEMMYPSIVVAMRSNHESGG